MFARSVVVVVSTPLALHEHYCWPSGIIVLVSRVCGSVLHSPSGESVPGITAVLVTVEVVVNEPTWVRVL